MKKLLSIILSLTTIITPIHFVQANSTITNWVYEDFEARAINPNIGSQSASFSRTDVNTYGASRGALDVVCAKDLASPIFNMNAVPGTTYSISAKIRVKQAVVLDKVQFVFFAKGVADGASLYNMVTVSNAGLTPGTWATVNAVYNCDGLGTKAGTGGSRFETEQSTQVHIRIGDGKIASTVATDTIEYYIDDFSILPQFTQTDGNLLSGGHLDTASDLACWGKSNSTLTLVSGGVNGSSGCVRVTETGNYGNIQQNVKLEYGKTYTFSFYAKSAGTDFVGQKLVLYVDRSAMRTADGSKPASSYKCLTDSSHTTLTADWVKYTFTYTHDLDESYVTGTPKIYPRIGSGTLRSDVYFDEFTLTDGATSTTSLTCNLSGEFKSNKTFTITPATTSAEATGYIVVVMNPYGKTTSSLAHGKIALGESFEYTANNRDELKNLIVGVYSINETGIIGYAEEKTPMIATSAVESGDVQTSGSFDTSIWTDGLDSLSATVYSNGNDNAIALIGLYNDTCFVGASQALTLAEGDNTISVPTNGANVAKLFIWDSTTQAPICEAVSIAKKPGIAIYVDSVSGNDSNPGTIDAPLATLSAGRDMATASIGNEDIYVLLKGGEYSLSTPLSISENDYSENATITYTSYGGQAVISGGKHIKRWSLYDSTNNIYRAYVGTAYKSRQLYVNGVRATRARSQGGLTKATKTSTGYTCSDTALASYAYPSDLEFVYYEKWTNPRCSVSSITASGSTATITMSSNAWSQCQSKTNRTASTPVYYENALELLDEEGEWYLNTHTGYLYYKPRFFEDITTADVVLPITEKLVSISGYANTPVKNISFNNIAFEYATWMYPTTNGGMADDQNALLPLDGGLGNGAVEVVYGNNINFVGCTFAHLGFIGLKMIDGIKDCTVRGNEFLDISGSALALGAPRGDYDKRIGPTDERYIIRNNHIEDNYIHHVACEYKSAAALGVSFPKDTTICNNEIYSVPYSGMHIGMGWDNYATTGTATENLEISRNYIHTVMNDKIYDGGAIYTIGSAGGGGKGATVDNKNQICQNYLTDIRNHYGALYTDEGSQFWNVSTNVIDLIDNPSWYGSGTTASSSKWLHVWTDTIRYCSFTNNYTTTANATYKASSSTFANTHVYTDAEWPAEARAVITASGISSEYATSLTGGLQEVDIANWYSLQPGDSMPLSINSVTGKNADFYGFSKSDVYISVSNPDVATIDSNFTIHAFSKGQATARLAIVEKGILKSFNISIYVD